MDILSRFSLDGRRAIVTGGSRGLCHAMAEGLHAAGAEVVLVGSSQQVHEAARAMGASGAPVHGVQGDLSRLEEIETIYRKATDLLGGGADILVNGAGIQHRCPAEDFPLEAWDRVLNVNLNAVFRLSQLAGRDMLARGSGQIINVASMTSFFGSERIPAYSASKGAVAQLTKALSNEWAGRGVRVNAIAPGYMKSALTADMEAKNPGQAQEITRRIPMGRWGLEEDVQGIAVFLASDASAYITGAVIPVDGGYLGK